MMNSERVLKALFFFYDAVLLPLCLQREMTVISFLVLRSAVAYISLRF